jgi:hypothetical protein
MLPGNYNWKISSSDTKVLAKRDVDAGDKRVQAIFQVVGAGKAVRGSGARLAALAASGPAHRVIGERLASARLRPPGSFGVRSLRCGLRPEGRLRSQQENAAARFEHPRAGNGAGPRQPPQ